MIFTDTDSDLQQCVSGTNQISPKINLYNIFGVCLPMQLQSFLTVSLLSSSFLLLAPWPACRRASTGAAGAVPEEAAAVLHRLRLYGHAVGPQDEGVQALHAERAGGLRDRQPGLPDGAGLPRSRQNGERAGLWLWAGPGDAQL